MSATMTSPTEGIPGLLLELELGKLAEHDPRIAVPLHVIAAAVLDDDVEGKLAAILRAAYPPATPAPYPMVEGPLSHLLTIAHGLSAADLAFDDEEGY